MRRDFEDEGSLTEPWHFEADDALDALPARPRFIQHLRESAAQASDFDGASSIFGELVANVIHHAPGPIWIDFAWRVDGGGWLNVRDSGPAFAYALHLPQGLAENGRGLYIVTFLARALSIAHDGHGSTATVVLPIWREASSNGGTSAW
jgi:anti-sigma regulatory factor (Ser/Thr protein kinase)